MDSAFLCVQMYLDALVLPKGQDVIDAHAHFERMPYVVNGKDIAADDAFLGSAISAEPFEDKTLHLQKGIHLHWALPDALTHGKQNDDDDSGIVFPVVPNRWCVSRVKNSTIEKQWMVESDYLYPEGEGALSGSIAVPVVDLEGMQGQPYRYMGRQYDLSATSPASPKDEYWDGLTAIGYGNPYFAAFYPNCKSVFGFCDTELGEKEDLKGLSYIVIGFYADASKDVIVNWAKGLSRPLSFEEAKAQLKAELKWDIVDSSPKSIPQMLVCYSRIDFTADSIATPAFSKPQIAIGNSATEALAAYLSHQINPNNKAILEKQIEGLFLNREWIGKHLDPESLLSVARHSNGFYPSSGGVLWTIHTRENQTKARVLKETDQIAPYSFLTLEIGLTLDALNKAQNNYNRACDELESLQHQLFADWSKYMLSAYPPEGTTDTYLDADVVRAFIEVRDLPQIEQLKQKKGELQGSLDSEGNIDIQGQITGSAGTYAGEIAEQLVKLRSQLEQLNSIPGVQQANVQYILGTQAAPRYWQPGEPSILLVGDVVQPSLRYGRDEALQGCEVFLLTQLAERSQESSTLVAALSSWILKNKKGQVWEKQPWNPFMIEWEAEFFPTQERGNTEVERFAYDKDYICQNYRIQPESPNYQPIGELSYVEGGGLYQGQNVLSGHASVLLKDVIVEYFENETEVPSSLNELYNSVNRLLGQDTHPSLSFNLGGFNEALLMREQSYQLPVLHPLGFLDEQIFAKKVRASVGSAGTHAPQPLWQFNPIRAGLLQLSNLQVIDSFGQSLNVDVAQAIISQALQSPKYPHWMNLPPRIVQPARLQVRWLAGRDLGVEPGIETNDAPATSPVVGWIVPQFLDRSLYVYDPEGRMIARFDKDGKYTDFPNEQTIITRDLEFFIDKLFGFSTADWDSFFELMAEALQSIEPAAIDSHTEIAWLLGQPLALLSLSIHLEVKGLKNTHTGWTVMQLDMERETRETHDFEKVTFPIRLGAYEHLNDGVVGYWFNNSPQEFYESPFYSTIPSPIPSEKLKNADEHVLEQTIESPAQNLIVLADPRGDIHVATGILPLKTLSIPSVHYQKAVKNMELYWYSGPILTEEEDVQVPLPNVDGQSWQWHSQLNFSRNADLPLKYDQPMSVDVSSPKVLREGWVGIKAKD